MKFSSRKDYLFTSLIIIICSLFVAILIFEIYEGNINRIVIWPSIVIILVPLFLLWLFFDTNYELNQTTFKYKSGPIRGEIPIDSIKEIIKNKTLWVGLKPATATKGLIIKYNKFDEIYITPLSNDSFIIKIVELNKNIKITGF